MTEWIKSVAAGRPPCGHGTRACREGQAAQDGDQGGRQEGLQIFLIKKVKTANCASASLSDSLICTHPKGGWTPDAASCLPPPDVQKKTSTRVTFACPLWGHVELVLPSAGEGMVKKCGPAESARWIRSSCEGVVTSTPQHGRQRNVSRPISPLPVLKPATLCRLSYASP